MRILNAQTSCSSAQADQRFYCLLPSLYKQSLVCMSSIRVGMAIAIFFFSYWAFFVLAIGLLWLAETDTVT